MTKPEFTGLRAIYINCTLKRSPELSHTQGLIDLSVNIMEKEGVKVEQIRLADHEVAPGVYPDMTAYGWKKDAWPKLFKKIIRADILVIGTPLWLGEKSSVCQKLIERLYAMSGETNDKGQFLYYGKTGGCIVTGNEDGVKHASRDVLYALQHIGYTIPPQADCGWLGEIGPGPSYLDKEAHAKDNDFTNRNATFMTYNLMHLASMLKKQGGYPDHGNSQEAWKKGERWAFEKLK